MSTQLSVTVSASSDGTLNWAVITTGTPPTNVITMVGNTSKKSAQVSTDQNGILNFTFVVNAFPSTAWELTIKKAGSSDPSYRNSGFTDNDGYGHDRGEIKL